MTEENVKTPVPLTDEELRTIIHALDIAIVCTNGDYDEVMELGRVRNYLIREAGFEEVKLCS